MAVWRKKSSENVCELCIWLLNNTVVWDIGGQRWQGRTTIWKESPDPKGQVDDDLQDVLATLKEKHPGMEVPKLCLWAKLIQSGHHADYVTPPNIPLITGKVSDKSKKGVADVVL